MSNIDWMTLGLAGQADENMARAKRAEGQVSELTNNLQFANQTLRQREQYISVLERKLAEAENEIRHYKSRDAGFLAGVRALIDEIKQCPHSEHHRLTVEDENQRAPLDNLFDKTYYDTWPTLEK